MKLIGPIVNDKDIITKGYLNDEYSPYVVSDNPPTNTNKVWIKSGVPYYFDPSDNSWNTLRFTTDVNKIVINNQSSEG